MRRPLLILAFLVGGVFVGSGAAMIYLKSRSPAPAPNGGRPIVQQPAQVPVDGLTIPPFSLIDHNGDAFTQENLKGKVTILDFFFIHCPTVCPMMTGKLAALTETLADTGVRFVSVSVDPTHDRPEQLRAYAKLHEADLNRWSFLTGDEMTVQSIVSGGLQFVMEQDKSRPVPLESGETIYNILHPTWFVLVGPDGGASGIKGLYKSSQIEDMERLAADARALDKQVRAAKPKQ